VDAKLAGAVGRKIPWRSAGNFSAAAEYSSGDPEGRFAWSIGVMA
jgi:hypothetical protein